jgi:L-alanine-DL-glutamate epimerase-like enolase superfamily enzyme
MKMEMLFYDLSMTGSLWILSTVPKIGRPDEFMIDVGYRWKNFNDALWVLRRIEDDKLFFVETPVHTDDLDGLARLADATTTPVAAGEFLQTRHEFRELMDRGHCDVIQPDMGRVGGLTEALRCARMAAERGLYCVPHAWKTGLTVAATRHFAAAASCCPYAEFFIRFLPAFLCPGRPRRWKCRRPMEFARSPGPGRGTGSQDG